MTLVLRGLLLLFVIAASGFIGHATAEVYGLWGVFLSVPVGMLAGFAVGGWFGRALGARQDVR